MTKPTILYCEADEKTLNHEAALFAKAGHHVVKVLGRKAMEEALRGVSFDVAVLGHTLTRDDRHHLPYMIKKSNRHTHVVVLHASGKHPAVDIALDSRRGERAVLEAIDSLLLQPAGT